MAAKSPAEPSARSNRPDRRREITGILLLAGALFSGLSVISMQVGGDPLMGPGGAAIASAFYGLFGFGRLSGHGRDGGRGRALLPRAPPHRRPRRGDRGGAAHRRALGRDVPALRRRARRPTRPGRPVRAMAGRAVDRLHRCGRRRPGGDHHAAGRGPAADGHQPFTGAGRAGLGRAARARRDRGRRGCRLADRARRLPREGRHRREAPGARRRKRRVAPGDRHQPAGSRRRLGGRRRSRAGPSCRRAERRRSGR